MLICKENDEHYEGKNAAKCFIIGDTANISDVAILIQQKLGEIDGEMMKDFERLYNKLPTEDFSIYSLLAWLGERRGKYISYEAW